MRSGGQQGACRPLHQSQPQTLTPPPPPQQPKYERYLAPTLPQPAAAAATTAVVAVAAPAVAVKAAAAPSLCCHCTIAAAIIIATCKIVRVDATTKTTAAVTGITLHTGSVEQYVSLSQDISGYVFSYVRMSV
jgi:hypothetical protein